MQAGRAPPGHVTRSSRRLGLLALQKEQAFPSLCTALEPALLQYALRVATEAFKGVSVRLAPDSASRRSSKRRWRSRRQPAS